MSRVLWLVLAISSLCLVKWVSAFKLSNDQPGYGVLIDAGSSSSKLKIYKLRPAANSHSSPRIRLQKSKKFKPGLSKMTGDNEVTDYLEQMVDFAKNVVPIDQHDTTPIYLMATAGMRFMDPSKAKELMDSVRDFLQNTTFRYMNNGARILSGEEEGVYAWIAASYFDGFFNGYKPVNHSMVVLEMGGGSTQITFIPDVPIYSEEFQITMARRRYSVYVQSYLGYGGSAIERKVAEYIKDNSRDSNVVDNPCMLSDDSHTVDIKGGKSLKMQGTGSAENCLDVLRNILKPNQGSDCQPKPCAIGPVYQPHIPSYRRVVATSAFRYTTKALGAVDANGTLNITHLRLSAAAHCQKTLKQLKTEGKRTKFASADCLMGLYIPTLLTVSYGFDENTRAIKVDVDGKIDWAKGAMLVELSSAYDEKVTCTQMRMSEEETSVIAAEAEMDTRNSTYNLGKSLDKNSSTHTNSFANEMFCLVPLSLLFSIPVIK